MKQKKQQLYTSSKTWKRVLAFTAALTMTAGFLPMDVAQVMAAEISAAAEKSGMKFPDDLVAAVQEYGGDQYDAEEVLYTLYKQGVIDRNGDILPVESYNINGQNVTEEELREMAEHHTADETVMAEGEELTWGEVAVLLTYKDYLMAFANVAKGVRNGDIDPDDPSLATMEQSLQRDISKRFRMNGMNLVLPKSPVGPSTYPDRVDDEMTADAKGNSLKIERKMPKLDVELDSFKYETKKEVYGSRSLCALGDTWGHTQMDSKGSFTLSALMSDCAADRTAEVFFRIHVTDGLGDIKLSKVNFDNGKEISTQTVNDSEGWIKVAKDTTLTFTAASPNCYREFELELYSPDIQMKDTNLHYVTSKVCVLPCVTDNEYLSAQEENTRLSSNTLTPAYADGPNRHGAGSHIIHFEENGMIYELDLDDNVVNIYSGHLFSGEKVLQETLQPQDGAAENETTYKSENGTTIVWNTAANTVTKGSKTWELVLHPQSSCDYTDGGIVGYNASVNAWMEGAQASKIENSFLEWRVDFDTSRVSGEYFIDSARYIGDYLVFKMKKNTSLTPSGRRFEIGSYQDSDENNNTINVTLTDDEKEAYQKALNQLEIPCQYTLWLTYEDSSQESYVEAIPGKDNQSSQDLLEQDTFIGEDGYQYLRFRVGANKKFKIDSLTCEEYTYADATGSLAEGFSLHTRERDPKAPKESVDTKTWYDSLYSEDGSRNCQQASCVNFDLASLNPTDEETGEIISFVPEVEANKQIYDTSTPDQMVHRNGDDSITTIPNVLDFSKASWSYVNEKTEYVFDSATKTLKPTPSGSYMDGQLIEYRIPIRTDSTTGEPTNDAKQWAMDQIFVEADTSCLSFIPSMYVDDCTNMTDTKVYCHTVLEPSGTPDYVDYLYFYVESTTPDVDYSGTAYIHTDFLNLSNDQTDYSDAKKVLPRINYGLSYEFKSKVPFFYQMDQISDKANIGYGDLYFQRNETYDALMKKKMTDWARERVYLYFNPLYSSALTSYDNLLDSDVFDTYSQQTEENNIMENSKEYRQSVPSDASIALKQIGLKYSDAWLEQMESEGGSINGIPLHYWTKKTIQAADDAIAKSIEVYNADYRADMFFELFRTAPYTNYYSTFEKDHDVYTAPSIKEAAHEGTFITNKLAYQASINEVSDGVYEYPLTLSYDMSTGRAAVSETVSTSSLPWYNGKKAGSYTKTNARGTGYDTPSAFTWIAEYTDEASGETTIIQPMETNAAVTFRTVAEDGITKLEVLDFSDSLEGTIRFKLRVANSIAALNAKTQSEKAALVEGKDYVYITSSPVKLMITSDTYLLVPSASKQLQVYQDDPLSVLFSSNVARRNEGFFDVSETTYRIQVFALDESGKRINDTPVYEAEDIGTYLDSLTSFRIPEEVLTRVSPENGFSYEAVISASLAEPYEGKQDFKDSALIRVNERPVRFMLDDICGYSLNSSDLIMTYHVLDAKSGFNGRYSVIRMSDNSEVIKGSLSSAAASGNETELKIPSAVLSIPDNSLKDFFAINLYGRNSADGEYSIASAIAGVYNDGKLKLAIGNETVGNGDSYDLSKRPFILANLNTDKHTMALSKSLTLAEIQQQMRLTDEVFVSAANGRLGSISDVMKWRYEDTHDAEKDEKESNLYYELFGSNSKLEKEGKLIIPDVHLSLMGSGDGSGIISAIHANTGMTTKVDITIDDVEKELYLFQFTPAIKTKVTYTDGKGTERSFESNDQGQLALYEENGFAKDSVMHAYSESGRYFYKNAFETADFLSGAGSAVKGELYPVNLLKLKRGYTVFVTLPDAKNTTVTVRGGAYRDAKTDIYGNIDLANSKYAAAADLLTAKDIPDDGNGVSNGLNGVKFTTDQNGTFTIYFNSKQIFDDTEDENSIPVMFAFELDVNGCYKLPFEITNDFGEVTLYPVSKTTDQGINYQSEKIYYSNSKNTAAIPKDIEYIGRTANSSEIHLLVNTVFDGFDGLIEKDASTNYTGIADDTDIEVRYVNRVTRKEIGKETSMQSDKMYVYPFSTVLANRLVMKVNKSNLRWLEDKHYAQMSLQSYSSGNTLDKHDVDYKLLNGEVVDDMDPDDIKELQQTLQDELTDPKNGVLGLLNEDGLAGQAISACSSSLFTIINQGRSPVQMKMNCVVLPTADPTSFEIMFGINAMDELVQDSEVDNAAQAEFSKSFNNETTTKTYGSTSDDYEYEKSDLTPSIAAYLKEGTELNNDQFNDYMSEFFEKEREEAEKDDNDDDDSDPKIKKALPILYGIMEANYDLDSKTWEYSYKGLNVGLEFEIEKEIFKDNLIVGPGIPVYLEIMGTLGGSFQTGQKYITVDESAITKDGIGQYQKKDREGVFLTRLGAKFGLSVYAALGQDSDVIGVTFGIEVSGGLSVDFALLCGKWGDDNACFGAGLGAEIGLALKFKAHALMFNYEATLFEVSASGYAETPQYKYIQNAWSNAAKKDPNEKPRLYNSRSDQLQSMRISNVSDDSIQFVLNTVEENVPKLRTMAKPKENLFSLDSSRIESIMYSDDGQMILFLDDNVASYANGSGVVGGTIVSADDILLGTKGGDSQPIPEAGSEMSESEKEEINNDPEKAAEGETVKNFGDYYINLSGSDGVYYAAWTQQRNETTKEKNDSAEVNLDDLAIAMNSTETIVSVYSNGKWTTQKLTNNFQPDMTPSIAGCGSNAIVVWKTSYSIDSENPLEASMNDSLVYSIYNGSSWSEPAALYDGSFGGITGCDTAILADGTALVTYSVQTGDTTEVFYSTVTGGAASNPIRLTMNENNETSLQVTTAGDNFVLAWFDTQKQDILLMCIESDGSFDPAFPESVSKSGYASAMSDIFTICGGDSIDDFSVFWSAMTAVPFTEGKKAGQTDYIETSVYGAKLYTLTTGEKGMTPPQCFKTLEDHKATISELNAVGDGDNSGKLILTETKFETVPVTVTPEAAAQMVINSCMYDSDEAYRAALNAKIEEYEADSKDGYVEIATAKEVSIYKAETFEFKEYLTLSNAVYDNNAVIPNLDTMILLTLTNEGITPVNSVKVNKETDEIQLEAPLLPGESVTIPYAYTVGASVRDIDFHITADNTSDAEAAAEGTLILDAPKLEVLGYNVKAENGLRTLDIQLNNTLAIPLATSEKQLVVRVYADEEKTVLIKEQVVTDKDLLTNIDDGMGDVKVQMTVEDIMDCAYVFSDEIPAEGIPVYAVVTVESEDGDEVCRCTRSAVIESMRTDDNTPFGIQAIASYADDSVTVNSAITNQSLQEQYLCNVNVTLYDADGNVIAEKNTNNDVVNYDTFAGEQTIADEKYNVTFTVGEDLTADELASVAYAVAGAYSDTMTVSFDMGIADDVEDLEKTTVLGKPVAEPKTPVSEWGEFEGWYKDEALTEKFSFSTAVCKNMTLYANWTMPNLDVSAEGCVLSPDGSALKLDKETRTLLTADGKNPTVNAGALSVDASKIAVLDENGKAISGADSTWFDVEWLDKDGNTVTTPEDAGEYTLKITPTAAGTAGGASGTLTVHVTVDPYQLSITGIVPEERSYDGTDFVSLNTIDAALVAPTAEGFFHGDEVQLNMNRSNLSSGTADKLIGKVNVAYEANLIGADAANYTLGENPSVEMTISPRTLKLEWGSMNGGTFTAGKDNIMLDKNGKATIAARPANLVEGDDVKVICTNDSTTSIYTDLTTTANKLEGADAAKYQLSSSARCTWHAISDAFVLDGASLTLDGSIGVNYYTHIPQTLLADSKAYILLTSESNNQKIKISSLTPEPDGRFKLTHFVAAKEMTDEITLQVRTGGGGIVPLSYMSGKTVPNNCFTYCVADYLKAIQSDTEGKYSEEIHRLTAALQDYGSCAQAYFDYHTDDRLPVSDEISGVKANMLEDYQLTQTGSTNNQLTLKSASLVLESDTAIRLYFTANSISRWRVTADEQALPIQQKDSLYYVELSNISASDLSETFTFEFTDGSNTLTVEYSPLTYAAKVLRQYSHDTKFADMAKALYLYSMAADRYFDR
ncbi:MAG: InlB B-repeat-containing protein [Oscillospiraceae bacterium]|nr:InlB B-repeat-containing protein [Oscillospiraceae bacterium]